MIRMIDGRVISETELIDDLKKDNIIKNEPDPELFSYLRKYYTSYTQRSIMANRFKTKDKLDLYINTKLSTIISNDFIEDKLPSVKAASDVLINNIVNNRLIVVATDYDVDGATSAVIAYKMLTNLFKYDNIDIIVNKREHGNGINKHLTNDLIEYNKKIPIGMLYTSDHGSHDRVNLTKLKEETGMDVVVTDHHMFDDEEAPLNMNAFVNPQMYDNEFRDITGTHVSYLVFLYTLRRIKNEHPEININYNVDYYYYLLIYVGMTTISDCMDLKSYINRKVVIKALIDLNNETIQHDAFWKYILNKVVNSYVVDESTLSYNVIPMLNTPGRIGDPRLSYELMISEDPLKTIDLYDEVKELNEERKDKQSIVVNSTKKEEYSNGIVKVMMIEDSEGIQGIIANNVMYNEDYKVVICFTKKKTKDGFIYIGSGRAQDDEININNILTDIAEKSDIIIQHGGHKSAIGAKIKPDLKRFYNELVTEIDKKKISKIEYIYVDDYIYSMKKLILNIFDIIELGPYGIGFEKPLYTSDFIIDSYRIFKKGNFYISMKIKLNNSSNSIISGFSTIKEKDLAYIEENLLKNKNVRLVYSLNVNSYRNLNSIQLNIEKIIFI